MSARFDARDLLDCYARGVFPMADAREDARVFLIDPERRGVIPLKDFHVSKRLARTVRGDPFEVRVDTAFHQVILECAASDQDGPRPGSIGLSSGCTCGCTRSGTRTAWSAGGPAGWLAGSMACR